MSDDDPQGGYFSCRVPGGSRLYGRVVKYGELAMGPSPEWCPLKEGPITVSFESDLTLRQLVEERDAIEGALAKVTAERDALLAELRGEGGGDALHPTGRCWCAGEGRCLWCQRTAALQDLEDYLLTDRE